LVAQGVAGLIFGRNVIQHHDPKGMTNALQAVLHEGATANNAMKLIKERVGARV
jgi:DhnA family fructose-bisphosphate aldolase class Ia